MLIFYDCQSQTAGQVCARFFWIKHG